MSHEVTPVAAPNLHEAVIPPMEGYDIVPGEPQVLPLDGSVVEQASEHITGFDYVQIAKLQMGESRPTTVWVIKNPKTGNIYHDTAYLAPDTGESFSEISQRKGVITVVDGNEPIVLGRSHEGKAKLDMDQSVSRDHLKVSLSEDGVKIEDVGSTYGTRMQAEKDKNHEIAGGIDRFESVMNDPAFLAVYQPGIQKIGQVDQIYKEHMPKLQAELERARNDTTPEAGYEAEAKIEALKKSYEKAKAEAKAELEEAIKPYLAARLELQRGDTKAGYMHEAQVIDNNGVMVTARGKKIGHRINGMKYYSDSNIRYGQLTLPGRFTSWAGSNGGKRNHITGVETTSTKHIVDLAAAMLAGNMQSQHEPIQIQVDPNAEYDLPREIKGKIRLYKPLLGLHRLAAERLIDGLDGVVQADVKD